MFQNEIKDIQNTLWSIYKIFEVNHSVEEYTNQAARLCKKYENNAIMLSFCQNLIISWTPVINKLAEEYRNNEN